MLTSDTAYLTIGCADIAGRAVPGQFVNVSCSGFLKRPFGIASVDKVNGTFCIGIKIVGEGTKELASIEEGSSVNVLGPLGNGFDLGLSDSFILVSGGTGVFPVNFAYEVLRQAGKDVTMVQGFRDKSQICLTC
ncbi:MAG: dihydroorotate dehydrogenase electron transfer subunit, partial [Lachnospiraceae bacterium]|nr:dihydroorotate dehydrogenase electron transfer subunit [Lachnospiraceae bacterium]